MPVATPTANGLMSATDKKYLQRYINEGTHLILIAELDVNIDWQRSQQLICGNTAGSIVFMSISIFTENDKDLHVNFSFLNQGFGLKFYKKGGNVYIKPYSSSQPFFGFIWSTSTIKITDITVIDDTYTEIPIK